jgi:ATP-dependent phosphofructokinase / diphosphate-dependent phosphofructokinase
MVAIKRIGILTSGGDCAGLNAVIRAVTIHAENACGWQVVGIHKGTAGLMTRPLQYEMLHSRMFTGNFLRMGGTILGTTNSGDPFAYPMPDGSLADRSEEVIEGIRMLDLDAVIGVGGDGSLAILRRLAQQGGFPLVGIPKTIDNDIGLTENAIGYTTAVATATMALDHLQPTAASHDRVMVLEVMGRDAGHIALNAGIAGGADVILIPEIPYDLDKVAAKIRALKAQGRNFALVVVAEAVKSVSGESVMQTHGSGQRTYGGVGHIVGEALAEMTGAETRVTVLGHIQRGGTPVAYDRILASALGVHAVDILAKGRFDRMVAWRDRTVTDTSIEAAIAHYHAVDLNGPMVHTARALGICLGD